MDKTKFNDRLNRFNTKPNKILWAVFGVLFVILCYCLCYTYDTVSIVQYEEKFAESILHGEFFNFYQRAFDKMQEIRPSHSPAYGPFLNLILGVWGIPMHLIAKAKGIDSVIDNSVALMYGKTLGIVATAVAVWLFYKVCRAFNLDKNKSEWGAFLFFTSSMTIEAIGVIGQTDIIGICFLLGGLIGYLKNQKFKFFILFFLAISCKDFALFVFVPLLLLKQKNILKILADMIIMLGLMFISNTPVMGYEPAFSFKSGFSLAIIERLFENKMPLTNGTVPVVLLLLGLLCVYCYLHKEIENEEELRRLTIFVPLVAMTIIFIGFNAYYYWILNLMPYMVLSIIYNTKQQNNLLLFETFGFFSMFGISILNITHALDIQNCKYMLPDILFGKYLAEPKLTLADIVNYLPSGLIMMVLQTVFVVCMLAFVWLSIPKNVDKGENKYLGVYSALRASANIIIGFVPVFIFILNLILA